MLVATVGPAPAVSAADPSWGVKANYSFCCLFWSTQRKFVISKLLVLSDRTLLYIFGNAFITSLSHRFHEVAQLDFSQELQQGNIHPFLIGRFIVVSHPLANLRQSEMWLFGTNWWPVIFFIRSE